MFLWFALVMRVPRISGHIFLRIKVTFTHFNNFSEALSGSKCGGQYFGIIRKNRSLVIDRFGVNRMLRLENTPNFIG